MNNQIKRKIRKLFNHCYKSRIMVRVMQESNIREINIYSLEFIKELGILLEKSANIFVKERAAFPHLTSSRFTPLLFRLLNEWDDLVFIIEKQNNFTSLDDLIKNAG